MSENRFSITVIYNGVSRTLEVQGHERVTSVLQRSIQLFGITQQTHLLSLFFADGMVIDEDKSASDAGLTAGISVYLKQNTVKGG